MESVAHNFKNIEHKNSSFNYPLIEITRILRAPIEDVWKAWSNADLMKQWFGPEGFTNPSARVLFREGGKFLIAMESPEKQVTWSIGTYEQIIPQQKIVYTDQFSDAHGHPISAAEAGVPGKWPEKCFVTVEFEECNRSHTKLVVTHEGVPREVFEDCCKGWMSTIDRLKKLLEKN